MYGYEWTGQNGIYRLSVNSKIEKEIRPVFKEELDYFGFNEHWTYPDTDAPLLWAEGIRRYILNGTCVAEATGGGFYTKPTIKIYTEGLNLEPIDVDALWKENERLMLGLEKTSMDFIRKTHDKYEKQGIVELIWGKDYSSRQGKGVIKLIEYSPFCPYTVDLEFYKEARRAFSVEEWIDVLISAADYNPSGYDSEQQKLYVLRRLLPFVEKRLNLMELAPKGTGKSYVYQKISKRGWLISGGTVSRASLIYDNQKKTGGLLTRFDFVGFDEIQSMTFDKPSQIQTALKDYMEFGEVQGFDAQVVADAGVIVLGNINASRFNVNENMMEEVSSVFSESASLDRFHGFIPGWEIPRMHQGLVANGWALNTEYFAEVLHLLRDDLTYTTIVDECLAVPAKPDKRDLTAIKRLCTAFVKLLYPNATCKEDIPADEFIKYCLEPAKEMRSVIKKQLCIIDPKEFNVPGKKDIPDIQYNYL